MMKYVLPAALIGFIAAFIAAPALAADEFGARFANQAPAALADSEPDLLAAEAQELQDIAPAAGEEQGAEDFVPAPGGENAPEAGNVLEIR